MPPPEDAVLPAPFLRPVPFLEDKQKDPPQMASVSPAVPGWQDLLGFTLADRPISSNQCKTRLTQGSKNTHPGVD